MRMLASIKVSVSEQASYKQDKLTYSSVYRKVNGKEKINRQTKYCDNCYEIFTEGKKGSLSHTAIHYNLIKLYCKEPEGITQVYSDAYQQFLGIKAMGAHKY